MRAPETAPAPVAADDVACGSAVDEESESRAAPLPLQAIAVNAIAAVVEMRIIDIGSSYRRAGIR
jgi:hypothetical protein